MALQDYAERPILAQAVWKHEIFQLAENSPPKSCAVASTSRQQNPLIQIISGASEVIYHFQK